MPEQYASYIVVTEALPKHSVAHPRALPGRILKSKLLAGDIGMLARPEARHSPR
jgi:hypothetical protein